MSTVKLNVYAVISRAIEEGIAYGWQRAHKYSDGPVDPEVIKDHIHTETMNSLSDVILWDDTDTDKIEYTTSTPSSEELLAEFDRRFKDFKVVNLESHGCQLTLDGLQCENMDPDHEGAHSAGDVTWTFSQI